MTQRVTDGAAGFTVLEWASFDAGEQDDLFAGEPRFDVPQLGLANASTIPAVAGVAMAKVAEQERSPPPSASRLCDRSWPDL